MKTDLRALNIYQSKTATPILSNTSAYLLCQKSTIYKEGDHYIIVGKVVEYQAFDKPALCFYEGKYALMLRQYASSKGNVNAYPADFEFA